MEKASVNGYNLDQRKWLHVTSITSLEQPVFLFAVLDKCYLTNEKVVAFVGKKYKKDNYKNLHVLNNLLRVIEQSIVVLDNSFDTNDDEVFLVINGHYTSIKSSVLMGGSISVCYEKFNSLHDQFAHKLSNELSIKRVKKKVETIDELSSGTETGRMLIEFSTKADQDIFTFLSIVEKNPSVTAKILKVASSSMYKGKDIPIDLKDAVQRFIGLESSLYIAINTALLSLIPITDNYFIKKKPYEQWSIIMALSMTQIAIKTSKENSRKNKAIFFTAGLFHNFGYLVFEHFFKEEFELCLKLSKLNKGIKSTVFEKMVLGMTVDQLLSLVFEKWGLAEDIKQSVSYNPNVKHSACHEKAHFVLDALDNTITQKYFHCTRPSNEQSFVQSGLSMDEFEEIVIRVIGSL